MWQIERTGDNVLTVRLAYAAGWKQDVLLLSDIHLDSPHCNRHLLRKLLRQAQERKAGIFIVGDLFDVMQSRDDKRRSKDDLQAKFGKSNYLDLLVQDAIDELRPYADLLWFISDGNHETAARKFLETDLIERVCHDLGTQHMGYAGFVRFLLAQETPGGKSGYSTIPLWFHHGAGGGGEITKGVMRAQRERGPVPDARIYVGGHIHQAWLVPDSRVRLTTAGKVTAERTWHISLPTLKDEFDLGGGFHVEKGRWPRVIGGVWLSFWFDIDEPGRIGFAPQLAT